VIKSSQKVVYAAWRTEQLGNRELYPEAEWWAVRMEHTAAEQPDAGRITGAQRLTQQQASRLLTDPHNLAGLPYEDPEALLHEMSSGRHFSNMTGWTRVS
jgi:3-mercaptopyruvate sulfurtransferase SseA